MDNENEKITIDIPTLENMVPAPTAKQKKRKPKPKLYNTAFALLARGKQFTYRSSEMTKISKTEAVSRVSGQIIVLRLEQTVKVRG